MASRFGSEQWAQALEREINGSSEYRNAAAKWGVGFNGNLLLAFEPDDSLERPLKLLVELEGGRCHGAQFVDDGADRAGFTLRAPFGLWRDILERRTMAATAILTGKMAIEGDRMTLLRHTAASRALIHCTASVDTDW